MKMKYNLNINKKNNNHRQKRKYIRRLITKKKKKIMNNKKMKPKRNRLILYLLIPRKNLEDSLLILKLSRVDSKLKNYKRKHSILILSKIHLPLLIKEMIQINNKINPLKMLNSQYSRLNLKRLNKKKLSRRVRNNNKNKNQKPL